MKAFRDESCLSGLMPEALQVEAELEPGTLPEGVEGDPRGPRGGSSYALPLGGADVRLEAKPCRDKVCRA